MAHGGKGCAFCAASAPLVSVGVLDEKWCARFGGVPVVALDHGWYSTVRGERRPADVLDPARFFDAHVRVACDYCAHGWIEDVRWRAEPAVLSIAQGRSRVLPQDQLPAVHRWAQLTALLSEFVHGMPRASTAAQRDGVRRGLRSSPPLASWVFAMRQRLPARVHLSQVAVPGTADGQALLQVVSVDLAQCSAVVVVPSDEGAAALMDRSSVAVALAGPVPPQETASPPVRALDLATTPHPHRVAVERLCTAAAALR